MRQVAFTIATNNYLSQACVLGKSFLKNNHKWQFCIAQLDYIDSETQKYLYNNKLGFILMDKIEISGFQEMKEI